MHIPDGYLDPEICIATGLVAAGGVAICLSKLKSSLIDRTVPFTGMMASLVFAGQMVNFPLPVAPVSGHLLGGVLASVIVGPWAGCIALTLVLFVQMALFSDGGWTALGANVLNMGLVGALGGYAVYAAVRRLLGGSAKAIVIGAVVASWVSVLAGAAMFCLEFAASPRAANYDLTNVLMLTTLFHSGIGLGEALITGLVVSFVYRQRPDLIYNPGGEPTLLAGIGRTVWAGVVVALAISAFLAPFASQYDDGLEAVADRTSFSELAQPAHAWFLDDYRIPLPGDRWQVIAVSLAGIGGTLAVLAVALLLGAVMKPQLAPREAGHGA